MQYSWNEFKKLPSNENLSLESIWIKYNDMIYHYGIYNNSGKKYQDDTINSYVETDYVEDYFI
jgi:hypothetical protein